MTRIIEGDTSLVIGHAKIKPVKELGVSGMIGGKPDCCMRGKEEPIEIGRARGYNTKQGEDSGVTGGIGGSFNRGKKTEESNF